MLPPHLAERGGSRSRRRAGRCAGLRGAPHRARRAARRARFHLRRRLPARNRHGPAQRRRFRQGLLCRPGSGLAHGASRQRAHPRRAGRLRGRSRRRPARRHGGRQDRRHHRLGRGRAGARDAAARPRRRRARRRDAARRRRRDACGSSSRTGRASPWPGEKRDGANETPHRSTPTASIAAPGRRTIRSMSPITTPNGACRNTTTARCTKSSCSTASRPACRGSPSCASATISAAPSTASSRRRSRATASARSTALMQDAGIVRNRVKIEGAVASARA